MFTKKLPHTYSYTSLKGKPLGLEPDSYVIPLHCTVIEERKFPCVLLTVPQSKDILQLLKWSMAGHSSPLLRAFNISIPLSDVEVLKGVKGVVLWVKTWQRHRLREREVPSGVWVHWHTDTGHNNLLWIAFVLIVSFWPDRLSPLCPVLLILL